MAWSQSGNIKGASGQPGASGASGLQGASGVPGATGPTGASGPAGTTTWSGITDKPAVIAAGVDAAAARNVISAEYTGNKGQPSGYAALDASGLVPSSQLPSFVDDVVEAANLAAFPATGESGKIYTALDTNKVYRWGGSSYTEISPSPGSTDAVPEGSTNFYYTAARADGRITAAVGSTVQAYSATLTTYAGKTAPTGAVVGTTDTQTLTNKDLSGSSNTFPAFLRRSVQTITSPTTLGASENTDYVTFLSSASDDSSFASVVALLHADGSNNSTTITDSSLLAANWTAAGNAKLSTSIKKFGTASLILDGSGDYISPTAASSNFAFPGDFTIEMWIYSSSNTGLRALYDGRSGTDNDTRPTLAFDGTTIFYYVSGGVRISAATSISLSTWYHVALCRSGTSTRLFLDGVQQGSTYTDSTSYTNVTNKPLIGAVHDSTGLGNNSWNGYIDEIRITKGVARYTSNFTAPSAAFPDVTIGRPTLPSAQNNTSRYSFRNQHSAAITIGASGSQAINGATGGLSLANGSSTELMSDGTGWYSF